MSRYRVGLISGTSLDGVDAALAEFSDGGFRLEAGLSLPYPDDLLAAVRRAADPARALNADAMGSLDARLGEHFAAAALALLDKAATGTSEVSAIGSHGQTVAHDADADCPYSVQLADPNRIAERTGITTVADFRRRDIAAGGQGAPLMSAFHEYAFRREGVDTAVLNLGGIANLTLLPGAPDRAVTGFDTGPANCLLDAWARRHLEQPFDENGAMAASGRVDGDLLKAFLADEFFRREPPKSTGTQHFSDAWLGGRLGHREGPPEDVAATLVELTAASVAEALDQAGFRPAALVCCGGGARNGFLLERIAARLDGAAVTTSDESGLPPEWVEATGFAWLAGETLAGRPGNRHMVTGAVGPRVLGAVYAAGR